MGDAPSSKRFRISKKTDQQKAEEAAVKAAQAAQAAAEAATAKAAAAEEADRIAKLATLKTLGLSDRPTPPSRTLSKVAILNSKYTNYFLPEEYWQEPSEVLSHHCRETDLFAYVKTNYIDPFNRKLDNAFKDEQRANKHLYTIKLNITMQDFLLKIRTSDPTYWARLFDFGDNQLLDIKRAIKAPITLWKKRKGQQTRVLVVDLHNAYKKIQEHFGFGVNDYANIMKELCYILCRYVSANQITGIVLCVQNHHCSKREFFTFIENLIECIGSDDILVLPGHNRSSVDDLYVMITALILQFLNILFEIFANDGYNDIIVHPTIKNNKVDSHAYIVSFGKTLHSTTMEYQYDTSLGERIPSGYVNNDGNSDPYAPFSSALPLPPLQPHTSTHYSYAHFPGSYGRGDKRSIGESSEHERSPYDSNYLPKGPRSPRSRRGGTIKYKKSLATKRSRKVYKKKYSQKYKKHKTLKIKKRL